jgi:hypothetical protein
MKKVLKAPLAIVIVIGIVYILGQRIPFAVNRLIMEIKPGQSVAQVIDILNSARKKAVSLLLAITGIQRFHFF